MTNNVIIDLLVILANGLTKFHMNMVIVLAGITLIGGMVQLKLWTIVKTVVELSHGIEHLKDACVNAKKLHNAPHHPIRAGAKYPLELITYADRQK